MFYQNNTQSVRTFYGIEFRPGDIKESPGFINCPGFLRVNKPEDKVTNKPTTSTKKSKECKPSEDNLVDTD